MSIRNIDTLLKTKRQKNDSIIKNKSEVLSNTEIEIKPTTLTESAVLLKPNFKIKHYLSNSRSKLNSKSLEKKSMDFGKKVSKPDAVN